MKTYPTLKYEIIKGYDLIQEQFYKGFRNSPQNVIKIDYGKVKLFIPITTSCEDYRIQIEFKVGYRYFDYITYNYCYFNIDFIQVLMNQYNKEKNVHIKNKLKELIDNKPFYLENNEDFMKQFKEKIGPILSIVDVLE